MKWKKKYTKWLAIALPIQWLLYYLVGRFPNFIEQYYSLGLYSFIARLFRMVFKNPNIPFGQILLFVAVVAAIFWLVRAIRHKKKRNQALLGFLKKIGLHSAAIGSVVYFLFMWLWGFNNYRIPIAEKYEIEIEDSLSTAQLELFCQYKIKMANKFRAEIDLADYSDIPKLLDDVNWGNAGHPHTHWGRAAKKTYWPEGMAYLGISGIFSPFTGEPFVNTDRPLTFVPAVACHEMAHQIGYASERDANFYGYILSEENPDKLINYSGQLMAMRYGLHALSVQDSSAYNLMIKEISILVQADLDEIKAYNNAHRSILGEISHFTNNIFLKLSGQAGTESYSQVVNLFVADYLKRQNYLHGLP